MSRVFVLLVSLIFSFYFINQSNANELVDKSKFKDLTIIVNSCDKYEELWAPFFKIFFLNWKDFDQYHIPIILVNNYKEFSHPNVKVFHSLEETSWSETFIRALETVNTKYVLYLQEDYFINKLDLNRLSELFESMKNNNVGYIQLSYPHDAERVPFSGLKDVFYKGKFEEWRTSLQAALWDKDLFSYLLNPKENIWMFEVEGSKRSQGARDPFLIVTKDYPVEYFNMVSEGYVISDNLSNVKNMYGLEWNVRMKKDSDASIKRAIYQKVKWLYNECFIPFQVMLNRFLKKLFSPY